MSTPENQPAPRLKAPPGTWDVHMHVYEPGYAIAPTATSKPHDAPTSEYLKVREKPRHRAHRRGATLRLRQGQ